MKIQQHTYACDVIVFVNERVYRRDRYEFKLEELIWTFVPKDEATAEMRHRGSDGQPVPTSSSFNPLSDMIAR